VTLSHQGHCCGAPNIELIPTNMMSQSSGACFTY